jgi:hypothetical protein
MDAASSLSGRMARPSLSFALRSFLTVGIAAMDVGVPSGPTPSGAFKHALLKGIKFSMQTQLGGLCRTTSPESSSSLPAA